MNIARTLTIALALAGSVAAHAADDKRLAQAKEAARKAQAALQQTQQERDTLRQQQAAMTAEKTALDERLSKAQADARASQGRHAQQVQALAGAEAELARVRAELADERVRREKAEASAAEAIAQAQQALQAQRQVTTSVTTLLEKSTTALARAEEANRTLHGLGLQAVDAYTRRTPEAMRTRSEPFLALGAVKLEDEAENLRKALDAQRVAR
jgi:chromosome segregation ATPase